MAAYLVTHSLLSSWLHLIRENPYEDLTTEGDPLAEFMLVLRREPTNRVFVHHHCAASGVRRWQDPP